ncbi:hypothetical protein [Streptomyces hoynatensis]|uniref:Uncharacterized protein n=1 Tax=Streptomyces hoynatensis TaxID=1141874 RepID=A0A3A9YU15_9ACTN|nr:hypothetical protein [Streptomyces hoynatensis]RKN39279.1 hypothetical protein D7294_22190 [Streptomyces hoynatensis]
MNLPKAEWATVLPFPAGTLVKDKSGRRGRLMGGLIERSKDTGRIVRQTAFLRPVGGGYEWQAPLDELSRAE